MELPFADVLRGRFGPRKAPTFDLAPAPEDLQDLEDPETKATDAALDTVDLPSADPALLLQKMENRLVRHHLANPDVLTEEEVRKLRYILNFARLADFEPGVAGPGGRRGRGDISVGAEIGPWRSRVVDAPGKPAFRKPAAAAPDQPRPEGGRPGNRYQAKNAGKQRDERRRGDGDGDGRRAGRDGGSAGGQSARPINNPFGSLADLFGKDK